MLLYAILITSNLVTYIFLCMRVSVCLCLWEVVWLWLLGDIQKVQRTWVDQAGVYF